MSLKRSGPSRAVAIAVLAGLLVSCRPDATVSPSAGRHLHVIGSWIGDSQAAFKAMVRPWEERTGTTVDYEASRDLDGLLSARIQAGSPPDLAGLSGPGQMTQLARAGKLISLDGVLGIDAMNAQYGQDWVRLGAINGHLVGIFLKASVNGLIYYDPKALGPAGVDFSTPPLTFDELNAAAGTIFSKTGKAPWCIGVESGAISGWPGGDWIKDFFLREAGPAKYQQWLGGQESWTSAEMKIAWQSFGQVVNSSWAYGGEQYVLTTNYSSAFNPMFASPPGCYLHHQVSFITGSFVSNFPGLQPGQDFNFFGFPQIKPQYRGAQIVAGDLFSMLRDSPQARSLMTYVSSPEAQQIWVKRGGAVSVNRGVSLDAYPDPLSRQMARLVLAASPPMYDISELQSNAVQTAFLSAVLAYISNPGQLDSILRGLEKKRTGG